MSNPDPDSNPENENDSDPQEPNSDSHSDKKKPDNNKTPKKPDRFEAARLAKLEKIEELGLDPWGQRFDGHIAIRDAREMCPEEPGVEGETCLLYTSPSPRDDR